jgi:hypothetical protein
MSNKAWVRYDGTGKIVPGTLIIAKSAPKVGTWKEVYTTNLCCPPETCNLPLEIVFENPQRISADVQNPTDVESWNTMFNLPALGKPFTSVVIEANVVKLYGGKNITLEKSSLTDSNCDDITSVIDHCGAVISIGDYTFGEDNCNTLEYVYFPSATSIGVEAFAYAPLISVSFPSVITISQNAFEFCNQLSNAYFPNVEVIGNQAFRNCTLLGNIYIPKCEQLGDTTGYDEVFRNISGNSITLTVNNLLMTCDSGNPDGDIVYLDSNNTVTIITV